MSLGKTTIITIDCWGTLIKSSPAFTEEKIKLTKKYFPDLTDEFILSCYKETKQELNSIIEYTGWQPTKEIIFSLLITKLQDRNLIKRPNIIGRRENWIIESFYEDYQQLATKTTPEIYSEETKEYVIKLYNYAKNLIISSNTMMIGTNALITTLEKLGIVNCFDSFRFSESIGFSKPHFTMYKQGAYHIGDNPITDGQGAFNAGARPIIINSNQNTIKDAYDIISQGRYIYQQIF